MSLLPTPLKVPPLLCLRSNRLTGRHAFPHAPPRPPRVCNQTALEYILSQPSLSAFASIVNTSAQQALLSSYDTDITVRGVRRRGVFYWCGRLWTCGM